MTICPPVGPIRERSKENPTMAFARPFTTLAALAVAALFAASPGYAQSPRSEIETVVREYLAKHPEDVQRIVKDYLLKNPDVLQAVLAELIKRPLPNAAADADRGKDQGAAIKSNADLLFRSSRQVNLGNRDGDVTMVEFFDYNCGYCKRALTDMMDVMKDDPKLKIVLKEMPILGPGSMEAAQVAVAVRMQDAGGQKYLAFHQKLFGGRGQANKESAMAAAREVGLDIVQLENDIASDEVRKTLQENSELARALGINGTPGYIIGDSIIPGAIGAAALKGKIQAARK
jgi:protein-disulfide isomerase